MPYKDKEKQKEYYKKWYKKHREDQVKCAAKRKWKHIDKMRDFINADKLSKGCSNCDEKEPCCLDYHHKEDNKEKAVATALNQGWGKERLEKEMKKCILLCRNCHAKVHKGLLVL